MKISNFKQMSSDHGPPCEYYRDCAAGVSGIREIPMRYDEKSPTSKSAIVTQSSGCRELRGSGARNPDPRASCAGGRFAIAGYFVTDRTPQSSAKSSAG